MIGLALDRMRAVDGWLTDAEGEHLARCALNAPAGEIVEIGSYQGRSTVVLATMVERVWAIDPHTGELGPPHDEPVGGTWQRFQQNIAAAGVADHVEPIRARSTSVDWDAPIGLLFIDGQHTEEACAADLAHFEPHLVDGALVLFHDYGIQEQEWGWGVRRVVERAIAGGEYTIVGAGGSVMAIRRIST